VDSLTTDFRTDDQATTLVQFPSPLPWGGGGSPKHLVSILQLDSKAQHGLFDIADSMEEHLACKRALSDLRNFSIALLFFEPSTRTVLSFQSAATRLGATTIGHGGDQSSASIAKGETIEDTVKIVSKYADVIVLRHSGENTTALCSDLTVPLINAGDGANEHPTQALMDLFMIRRLTGGSLDNLHIGIGFDPAHSRSIRSLCYGLSQHSGNSVTLVAPDDCQLTREQREDFEVRGLKIDATSDLDALLECELVYVNRFQTERLADMEVAEQHRVDYKLTADMVKKSKIQAILDPLPRVGELAEEVDDLPQALYFDQAGLGLPLRMAVLQQCLSETKRWTIL
jgi:aspartate carbamoyltransferase catalytic subunit